VDNARFSARIVDIDPMVTKPKLLLGLALVLGGVGFHCPAQTDNARANPSAAAFLEDFKNCAVFWRQFETGKKIVALHETNVLQSLEGCLTNEDRHVRGNAAFIFAALGDERGFGMLQSILTDRSPRPKGQGTPGGNRTLHAQIASDRYYAVHLFGDLKDPRAVPILIPLLHDDEVKDVVPWSLGEIGDRQAVPPLIKALSDKDPSMRVLAIGALEKLKATEALPRLRQLLNDNDRSNFGALVTVADAAGEAIIELKPPQDAIDRLDAFLTSSSGLWVNGFPSGVVSLPEKATVQKVVARIMPHAVFDSGHVTNYRILESRPVNIPEAFRPENYLMVLVKTNLGEKIVVMRYSSEDKGWWHRIYDANGPPYLRYY
jgi:hypothetical protein